MSESTQTQAPKSKKKQMMLQLSNLNAEMEICMHQVMENGQFRRKISRQELAKRNLKRKRLEKEDIVLQTADDGDRVRGSKVALEESMVAATRIIRKATEGNDQGQEHSQAAEDSGETQQPDRAETEDQNRSDKKYLYRMPKISSQRLAALHGQALAAHAAGNFPKAIQLLNNIAADSPSAPQIYSSLGMVHESLKNYEKAYGAYHVAAVLCKKDYTVWVRAGDLATRVGGRKWIEHALKDYKAADNLKPPGPEVPCKLAAAHLQLGNLADCLTILTNLQDRGDANYWSLYASCLLKLGHACVHQRSENYIVKRWLKKYAKTFDWQGRRLQALVMALEHSAGSTVCKKLREWVVQRAIEEEEDDDDDYVTTTAAAAAKKDDQEGKENRVTQIEMPPGDQPLSASVARVCAAGAELMKHCLGLEAFEGCHLAGEAVSEYLKERGRRRRQRTESREKFESQSLSLNSLMMGVGYSDEDGMSDEEDALYLSDDEDIDNNDDPEFINSIDRGVLPPELQVLYGLALVGIGGRRFLAGRCLEAISSLTEDEIEPSSDIDDDPSWKLFSAAMTSPLNKTSAFALVIDVLRKLDKEEEWASVVSPLLKTYLSTVKEDISHDIASAKTPLELLRHNQMMKMIVAEIRYDLFVCEKKLENDVTLREGTAETLQILDRCLEVATKHWKVEEDCTLKPRCSELVELISKGGRLSKIAVLRSSDDQNEDYKLNVVSKLQRLVDLLLDTQNERYEEEEQQQQREKVAIDDWAELPFPSKWQTARMKRYSISAYNHLVGSRVSLFCGWEKREFSMSLMKRKNTKFKHFGISLHEGRVTGKLGSGTRRALGAIWKRLSNFLKINVDFDSLALVEETPKTAESTETAPNIEEVAMFSENHALQFLLNYAHLCSLAVGDEVVEDGDTTVLSEQQLSYLQIVLSIVLPVTQFGVTTVLWDCPLGQAAMSLSGFDEWRNIAAKTLETNTDRRPLTKRRRQRKQSNQNRLVEKFKNETSFSCLRKFLKIPVGVLQRHWETVDAVPIDMEQAKKRQTTVERCMVHLRESLAEAALMKFSLDTSIAMMELIPFCRNPFPAFLQAPMFCNHASPGGKSDLNFKTKLPETCEPVDALQILCRAECLSALHFGMEAAFLASFVVRQSMEHPPGSRWKVIRLCAYNTCLCIQAKGGEDWESDVVVELRRIQKEGLDFMRSENLVPTVVEQEEEIETEQEDGGQDEEQLGDTEDGIDKNVNAEKSIDQLIDEIAPAQNEFPEEVGENDMLGLDGDTTDRNRSDSTDQVVTLVPV